MALTLAEPSLKLLCHEQIQKNDMKYDDITLVSKLDQDIVRYHLHAKIEVLGSSSSNVLAQTETNTYRQADVSENITYAHLRMVKIWIHSVNAQDLIYIR